MRALLFTVTCASAAFSRDSATFTRLPSQRSVSASSACRIPKEITTTDTQGNVQRPTVANGAHGCMAAPYAASKAFLAFFLRDSSYCGRGEKT
mmetsp:Transcript_12049/g.22534  ORF Transcript_12049/g.22534 Transcript_12049/m.22534 type:complete len:93 (+) Transcript_12049:442-720(+)